MNLDWCKLFVRRLIGSSWEDIVVNVNLNFLINWCRCLFIFDIFKCLILNFEILFYQNFVFLVLCLYWAIFVFILFCLLASSIFLLRWIVYLLSCILSRLLCLFTNSLRLTGSTNLLRWHLRWCTPWLNCWFHCRNIDTFIFAHNQISLLWLFLASWNSPWCKRLLISFWIASCCSCLNLWF